MIEGSSSMGSILAGDLCDEVLWELGERYWAASPDVQQRFGLLAWLRCRGGVLVIAKDRTKFREFYRKLHRRIAAAWSSEVQSTCRSKPPMLDVTVYQGKVGKDGLPSLL